jgi:hypothetical protein
MDKKYADVMDTFLQPLELLQAIADGDWLDDPRGCQSSAQEVIKEVMKSIKDPIGPKYVVRRPDGQRSDAQR